MMKTYEHIFCPHCLKANPLDVSTCFSCKSELALNSKYYILDVLGENTGMTYLVTVADRRTPKKAISDKIYAVLKEFSMKKMKAWKEEELFLREQKILSSLDHPFIPKMLESFEIRQGKRVSYYTVQEYIANENLHRNYPKFDEEKTLSYLIKLAEILDELHQMNPPVIHRDIKLSNIIFKEEELYLIDFGSATNILREEGGSTIAGTFGYMAPEQFLGKAYPASDYYALGVLGLVLLTGKPPESLIKNFEVQWEELGEDLNISQKMQAMLKALLSYDAKERIASKEELLSFEPPRIKERDMDLILFLKEYQALKRKYNKDKPFELTKKDKFDIFFYLLGAFNFVLTFQFKLVVTHIYSFFFFLSFLYIQYANSMRFSKEKGKDMNVTLAALSFLAEANLTELNQEKLYKDLDKELHKKSDLQTVLHYRKLLEDSDFISPHIKGVDTYSDQYIKALEKKLNNPEENNFLISTKDMIPV